MDGCAQAWLVGYGGAATESKTHVASNGANSNSANPANLSTATSQALFESATWIGFESVQTHLSNIRTLNYNGYQI
jgi:hypothetical protein